MIVKLTKSLKARLLKAMQLGYIETKDFQELTNEQPLFPEPITGIVIYPNNVKDLKELPNDN